MIANSLGKSLVVSIVLTPISIYLALQFGLLSGNIYEPEFISIGSLLFTCLSSLCFLTLYRPAPQSKSKKQAPKPERRTGKPPSSKSNMPPLPSERPSNDKDGHWFVIGPNKDTFGPYTLEQLKGSVECGDISHTTYVWKEGMENWVHLFEIEEFDRRRNQEDAA